MNFLLEAFNNAHGGDEFYTRYDDIKKELANYDFSGMVVYCNCDNPQSSSFVKYFRDNFDSTGIKCLLATFYSNEPILYRYDGVKETTKPIKSGSFLDNGKVMDLCDIVVTNPPFSEGLPSKLVNMVISKGKKYLIIAPIQLCIRKGMLELVNNGDLKCGYNQVGRFDRPDGSIGKVTTYWWTNMPVEKPDLNLTARYDERLYPKYDNYDAIECSKFANIPKDYDGKIGVPISFIRVFNPNQFTIHGVLQTPKLNGKNMYTRFIISKK